MRVGITNTYVGNKRLPAYREDLIKRNCAVYLTSESQKLGGLDGYRRLAAPSWQDRFAREVAVYTRNNVHVDAVYWRQITKDVGGNSHERSAVMAYINWGGKWAPISMHANPTRVGKGNAQNRVLLEGLYQMWNQALVDGYTPILGGDWNRRAHERGKSTPYYLANRVDGKLHLHGIDGIIVPSHVKLNSFNNRGRPPGSDHPLLVANVTHR